MGFTYRKTVRAGKGRRVNLSKSGASVSQSVGPVTANSRGRFTVRLGKGLAYRSGCAVVLLVPFAALALTAIVFV